MWARCSLDRAQYDFSTLRFARDATVDSRHDGPFWYGALHALYLLCLKGSGQLRRGFEDVGRANRTARSTGQRETRSPKHADTGIYSEDPQSGIQIHLLWRVHLKTGARTLSESLYWEPVGPTREERQYLVGWIGAHPE